MAVQLNNIGVSLIPPSTTGVVQSGSVSSGQNVVWTSPGVIGASSQTFVSQTGSVASGQMAVWNAANTIQAGLQSSAVTTSVVPSSAFTTIGNIFTQDVTFSPGVITSLVANVKTNPCPGLLVTDAIQVNCVSSAGLSGACIANTRVSAPDVLELTLTTGVVLGLTLGSLTFRVLVFRSS